MRNAFRFAWLSSVRQPARTVLGVLGVVAVGALLFDMLLLSRGLVLSFGTLLDRVGFDIRVLATEATPFNGPPIEKAADLARSIGALPGVDAVLPVRIREVEVVRPERPGNDRAGAGSVAPDGRAQRSRVQFAGADPQVKPMWTMIEGRDLSRAGDVTAPLVVNRNVATNEHLSIGSTLRLGADCSDEGAPPPQTFTVVGLAEFPFDDGDARSVAGRLRDLQQLCGEERHDLADMLLVRSTRRGDSDEVARTIRSARPDLYIVTNDQILERFSRVEFSYFQQISFVLVTITLFFGFLLIAVLLTVSVNQRLGEIAAIRAIGLSRGRVMAGVLCESAIIVGTGGVLAVPVGFVMSSWLDTILRALPGIPTSVSFFVFEPRALVLYLVLLVAAAVGAALYPMRIVSTLPIAGTLRREVVS